MEHLFVFAQLLDEFFDPVLVEKYFLLRSVAALVGKIDFQPRIEKGELAQAGCQSLEFKFRRDREDRRIGQERDQRSGDFFVFDFADDGKLVGRFPFGEGHVVYLAVARYFHLEPF